jgi:hypothetical protein
MRKVAVFLVIAAALVLATLAPAQNGASYAGPEDTPTATNTPDTFIFPIILRQPTLTPTPTATPTASSTASPCGTGFNGHLELRFPKDSYATYIENVVFSEYLFNSTSSTICFGILGMGVTGPQTLPFKTSWDGGGAPGGRLEIWAGCHGPAGLPCANSAAAGRHEDQLGDGPEDHSPWEITTPGTYNATLYVCYSPYSDCLAPGGHWAAVSGAVPFTMIHWTPTPSAVTDGGQIEPTPKPFGGQICYLITDDPAGIYLKCDGKQTKSLPRLR